MLVDGIFKQRCPLKEKACRWQKEAPSAGCGLLLQERETEYPLSGWILCLLPCYCSLSHSEQADIEV